MENIDICDATGQKITTEIGTLDICRFLGKGKSGYSYLAVNGKKKYVLKLMHYEQVSCYGFNGANKIDLETEAFRILKSKKVPVPELIVSVPEKNYLLKEFIDGMVATEYIMKHELPHNVLNQLFFLADSLEEQGINIDYFPNNFVLKGDDLYYIDYEINPYQDSWNLKNWGIWYWANSAGMKLFKETGDAAHINRDCEKGIPHKEPFRQVVEEWLRTYSSVKK